MKEKALEDNRREQLAQQQLEQQRLEQQKREAELKSHEKPAKQYLKVPQNVGVHVDVPPQILQVCNSSISENTSNCVRSKFCPT